MTFGRASGASVLCSQPVNTHLVDKDGVTAQDAKELLAQVRELKFALEESDQAAEHLATELAAAQV